MASSLAPSPTRGDTVLHQLVSYNYSGDVALRSTLHSHPNLVHKPNAEGSTALHLAVRCAYFEGISLLLSYGADPNTADARGRCALHLAALLPNYSADAARLLIDAGASAMSPDADGFTPLHIAAACGHSPCLRELVTRGGADLAMPESSGGQTALHLAAEYGHVDAVRELLSLGAPGDAVCYRGSTPADVAAASGWRNISLLISQTVARAPPHAPGGFGGAGPAYNNLAGPSGGYGGAAGMSRGAPIGYGGASSTAGFGMPPGGFGMGGQNHFAQPHNGYGGGAYNSNGGTFNNNRPGVGIQSFPLPPPIPPGARRPVPPPTADVFTPPISRTAPMARTVPPGGGSYGHQPQPPPPPSPPPPRPISRASMSDVGNSSFRSAEDNNGGTTDDDGFLSAGEMSDARSVIAASPQNTRGAGGRAYNDTVASLRIQLDKANERAAELQERLDEALIELNDVTRLEARLEKLRMESVESTPAASDNVQQTLLSSPMTDSGASLSPLSTFSDAKATLSSPQKELLVLLTSQTSSNDTRIAQESILRLFEAVKLIYNPIDCSELENAELRASCWALSGKRATYPQVFSRDVSTGSLSFLGDWPAIEALNESNAELGGLDTLLHGFPRQRPLTDVDPTASLRTDTIAANVITEVDNEEMTPAGDSLPLDFAQTLQVKETPGFVFARPNAPAPPASSFKAKGLSLADAGGASVKVNASNAATKDTAALYRYSFESTANDAAPNLRAGTGTSAGAVGVSTPQPPRQPPPSQGRSNVSAALASGPLEPVPPSSAPPPAALEARSMAIWGRFFEAAARRATGSHAVGELEVSGSSAPIALAQAVAHRNSGSIERLLLSGASAAAKASLPDSTIQAYPLIALLNGVATVTIGPVAGLRLTPLHIAAALGDVSILSQLVDGLDNETTDTEANIDARDEQGASPLMIAASCALAAFEFEGGEDAKGHNDCISFLLGSAAAVRGIETVTGVALQHIVQAIREVASRSSSGAANALETLDIFRDYL